MKKLRIKKQKNDSNFTFFELKVFSIVKKIPKGKLSTYKIIAEKIGNERSFRAVGQALSKNCNYSDIPCHRVIKSNGFIGGYNKGHLKKIVMLKSEGITIKNNFVDCFESYIYPF